ncbi:MAG: extracellular solute-binding protein [Chloroflexota bacterium]
MHRLTLSRRQFLSGLGALGLALPVMSLAACGSTAAVTTASTATAGSQTVSTAASPALGTKQATVSDSTSSVTGQVTKPAAAQSVPPGSVRLVYMCDIAAPYTKVAQHWADTFPQSHPGTTVEYQPVADHYPDKLTAAYAAGSPPDVYRYLQANVPIDAAVKDNLLLDLSAFANRDKYDFSDFLPEAIGLYRWHGKLYALPRDYGAQFVVYNVDLFKKTGVEMPPTKWDDKAWTFTKFIDAATRMTVNQGGITTQWGAIVNTGWRPWSSFVYSNGATVVQNNSNGESTQVTLTDDHAVAGMQFLQDLMYKYHVAPQAKEKKPAFSDGTVAMVIDNPGVVKTDRQITSFNWDVAALPIGDHSPRRGTGGGGTGWGAAATTKIADQAWQFITFISSQQAELEEVAIGGTTPSRTSVINSTQFLAPTLPPKGSTTFPDGQKYVVADPVNVNWPTISSTIVNAQMAHLWDGSQSARQVATTIKQLADPQFQTGLTG